MVSVARGLVCTALLLWATRFAVAETQQDTAFQRLAQRYVDEFAAFSPVSATSQGDHRFDAELDDLSQNARNDKAVWLEGILSELKSLDKGQLSRANQVDHSLLGHALAKQLWQLEELQEWAWNPLVYTSLTGNSVYSLVARDFEAEEKRFLSAAARLRQLPRLLAQARENLDRSRVPVVHAKTAVAQNRGVLKILDNMIRPKLDRHSAPCAEEVRGAIAVAERALGEHQNWLETELLPASRGDFRIGVTLYDKKLAYTLHSTITRQEIREVGYRRIRELHTQMYELAKPIYLEQFPLTRFPQDASPEYQRSIIRFALEQAYAQQPPADRIVEEIQDSVAMTTRFLREKDLLTVQPDPLEIILMPEFRRGVSLAYCDAPGPLETNQKTFYAVSPIPNDWTGQQTESFLREYNTRSLHVLTIHEAMPGHFLQLAHANRFPGKLRHLLQSGVFVEGWAVYVEWMMCEAGFLQDDPLMKLVTLKWYLRDVTNALLDQAVHVDGISRSEAMYLMVEEAFQEEREAAGKWTRAQLTSAQLSTYYVGYLEHVALRREAESTWGADFDLKEYHNRVLSYASPAPQFVRALLFDKPIPE